MKTIRYYLFDLFSFLKNPARDNGDHPSVISTGRRFGLVVLTKLCIAITVSLPLIYVVDRFVLRLRTDDVLIEMDMFPLIISAVIIAPVLEELAFRFPLRLIKPRYLKLAVYASSIIFGLIHSINYTNDQALFFLLLPVIVSSQAIGGFLLAYLRLREGFLWSVFSNMLFNASVILASIIFSHDKVVLEETTAHYSLKVREYMFKEGKQVAQIYGNNSRIDSIVWKQASLQSLVDSLSSKPMEAHQTLVDVEFRTTQPVPADSVILLLGKEFRIE